MEKAARGRREVDEVNAGVRVSPGADGQGQREDEPKENPIEVRAKVIQRLLWLLWLACALCITALFRSDNELIPADAILKLPYVSLEASVSSFLFFGPLFVLALWIYVVLSSEGIRQHLFSGREDGDFLIVLSKTRLSKLIAWSSAFILVPAVLGYFLLRTLARPEAGYLAAVLMLSIIASVAAYLHFVQAHRWRVFVLGALLAAGASYGLWSSLRAEISKWQRLDLAMANFTDMDLTDVNLTGSQLDGAILNKAKLRRTGFQNALLRHAKMHDTDLRGALFSDAVLDNAEIQNALAVGESGDRTVFSKAKLNNATVTNSRFMGAKFEVDGEGLRISESSFVGANLEGAKIRASHLTKVDFTGAQASRAEFPHTRLQGVKFTGATLTGANFSRAYVAGTDFSSAALVGAKFSDLNPDQSGEALTTAQGHLISFANADLSHARFELARIVNANFWRATLSGSKFDDAVIANSIFVDAQGLAAASFARALICNSSFLRDPAATALLGAQGADYSNAYLSAVTFEGISLAGASFHGAILEDVSFVDSDVSGARFEGAVLVVTPAMAAAQHKLPEGAKTCRPPNSGAAALIECEDLPAWKEGQAQAKLYCHTLVGR